MITTPLYPPTLPSSIPAVYLLNGIPKMSIPYKLNPVVGIDEAQYLGIRIKSMPNNQLNLADATWIIKVDENTPTSLINCNLGPTDLKIGQYYKIQVASLRTHSSEELRQALWSSPAIFKYIGETRIGVEGLEANKITTNNRIFTGFFNSEDVNEKIYSYSFIIKDNKGKIIKDTGVLIHNNNTVTNKDVFELLDFYTFSANQYYTIQYSITTINGLKLTTPEYKFQIKYYLKSTYSDSFIVTPIVNNENGYVEVSVKLVEEARTTMVDATFKIVRITKSTGQLIEIGRLKISQVNFSGAFYRDYTVEHGEDYLYALQEYHEDMVSEYFPADGVATGTINLEHCFLTDGERQLKIKYNPKISSYKSTILETKTNTIGSKYPFFFKNGIVNYKEFPISGLISVLMDEEGLFAATRPKLQETRTNTPSLNSGSYEPAAATNLTGSNFYTETQFKNEVLDWLNNGKLKYFRSPAEGNFIVRLMNSSLSPNDTLGRMLHTFNTTASEAQENNYSNLLALGLYDLTTNNNFVDSSLAYFGSVNFTEKDSLSPGLDILNDNFIRAGQIQNMFLEDCAIGDVFEINGTQVQIGITGSYHFNEIVESLKYIGYQGIYNKRPEGLATKLVYKMQGKINSVFKMISGNTLTEYPIKQFLGADYRSLNDYDILTPYYNNIKYSIKITYLRCYVDGYLNPQGTETFIKIKNNNEENYTTIELQPANSDPNKRHYYELFASGEALPISGLILGDKVVCEMCCSITENSYELVESDTTTFGRLSEYKGQANEILTELHNTNDLASLYKDNIAPYLAEGEAFGWSYPISLANNYIPTLEGEDEILETEDDITPEDQFKAIVNEIKFLRVNETMYKPKNYWNTAFTAYINFIDQIYLGHLNYVIEVKEGGVRPDDSTTVTS